MIYTLPAAFAEMNASFNFCAHSSQQTSTTLPPILTETGLASSSQSQAAQVFLTMKSPLEIRAATEGRGSSLCS
jgi:hypothetical protein